MKLRSVGWIVAALCLLGAADAGAQSLYGQADIVVDRARTTYGATQGFNKLFTQAYTVGYESVLWDRRIGTWLAEGTFLWSSQSASELNGKSYSLGGNVGANLFPNRPFTLSFNAARAAGRVSPQFPGADFGASAVPLPPGFVPTRYDTTLSSLEMVGQLTLPSWPQVQVSYRSDAGSTAVDQYEGTEKNRMFAASVEKNWARVRNQLIYTSYAGESRASFPTDRSQDDLSYNLSSDLTQTLRANARAGFRDIFSATTLTALPGTPSAPGASPPVLTNDLRNYYSSGGLDYRPNDRLGVDALVGFERLDFDRRGRRASSDVLYTTGSARYLLLPGLNVTGFLNSALRSEDLDNVSRKGSQRSVGAGVSYAPTLGVFRPVVGAARSVGRTETLQGESGSIGTRSANAGIAVTLGRWLIGGTSYEQAEANDDIFSLGNYTRGRWLINGQSQPLDRLRLDVNWERTSLDQGLGADRLLTDLTYGQGSATWQLTRSQSVAARYGTWRTESGPALYRTTYGSGSYRAQFRTLRLQVDVFRDNVRSQTIGGSALNDRVMYRFLGMLEYRLRLLIFGFDYLYANNTQSGLSRYLSSEWRIRIGRRFGVGLRPS